MSAKVTKCQDCGAPIGTSGNAPTGWCQGDPPHWNSGKDPKHPNQSRGLGRLACTVCGDPLRDHSILRPCSRDPFANEPVRRCSTCGIIKPSSEFSPRRGSCKVCRNADARSRHQGAST